MAQVVGLVPTFLAAAVVMVRARRPLWSGRFPMWRARGPAVYRDDPDLAYEPDPHEGPVVLIVRYIVPPDAEAQFLAAMEPGAAGSAPARARTSPACCGVAPHRGLFSAHGSQPGRRG